MLSFTTQGHGVSLTDINLTESQKLLLSHKPPGAGIEYPAAAFAFIEQQILVVAGTLSFTDGSAEYRLGVGDCLALGPPAPRVFENTSRKACSYLVVVARKG